MDLQPSAAVAIRSFALNTVTRTAGFGTGKGLAGCQVDRWKLHAPEVRQFAEPRELHDGLDVNEPFFNGRVAEMAGTIYGLNRAAFFSAVASLRDALDPVLAYAADPTNFGFVALTFSEPRTGGTKSITLYVRPNGLTIDIDRDKTGGVATAQLSAPWTTSFLMRDPAIHEA